MSSRGRGRGRGQVRTGSPEAESSSQPTASTSASAASSAVPSQARSSSSSVANLLRKNDYTKKSNTPTMKFTPNMARRKPAQVDLSVVKKEKDDKPAFNKPLGRGRGKPMMQEMTASSTFAMGPSQGGPRGSARSSGFSGGGSAGSGAGASRSKAEPGADGPSYDSSDEDDDWEPPGLAATDNKPSTGRSADLSEIDKEDEMAPLVLPKDETRLMGEAEQSIKAADEAQSTLPLPPSQLPKVKAEPDQAEEEARSALSTPMPSSSRSSTHPPQDGSTDEEQDTKKPIVVKSEQVAEGFMQDQTAAAVEQLYVFQFPRVFPKFKAATPPPSSKPEPDAPNTNGASTSATPMNIDEDKKPDVKPKLPIPSSSAQGYVPGRWQGWGKNSGNNGRDLAESDFEGQIGRLRVHASGKVSLVLGSGKDKLRYDILPAAPASFLQEVAVQVPKPMKQPDSEEVPSGLYIMGQTDKKYVVRPNISQLLHDLELEKKSAEALRTVKKEDAEASLPKGQAGVGDLLAKPTKAPASSSTATGRGAAKTGNRGKGRGRGAA